MRILPKSSNAFNAEATMSTDGKLHIDASLSDQAIRDLGIKHDGFETVNAYIPTANGGAWQKVALKYETEVAVGGTPARDLYDAVVDLTPEQQDAVRCKGIAFEVQLNSGEDLWAQKPGENLRVHDER